MKLRYERGALIDLEEIFSYIARNNREAASRLVMRIEQAAALIAEHFAQELVHVAALKDKCTVGSGGTLFIRQQGRCRFNRGLRMPLHCAAPATHVSPSLRCCASIGYTAVRMQPRRRRAPAEAIFLIE